MYRYCLGSEIFMILPTCSSRKKQQKSNIFQVSPFIRRCGWLAFFVLYKVITFEERTNGIPGQKAFSTAFFPALNELCFFSKRGVVFFVLLRVGLFLARHMFEYLLRDVFFLNDCFLCVVEILMTPWRVTIFDKKFFQTFLIMGIERAHILQCHPPPENKAALPGEYWGESRFSEFVKVIWDSRNLGCSETAASRR